MTTVSRNGTRKWKTCEIASHAATRLADEGGLLPPEVPPTKVASSRSKISTALTRAPTPLNVAACQSADECARDPELRVPSWTRTAIQDPPILMGSDAMHCAMFRKARSPGKPCNSDAMTSPWHMRRIGREAESGGGGDSEVPAHWSRTCHVHCRSGTLGMASHNSCRRIPTVCPGLSHLPGQTPSWFHTRVLPACRWIPALVESRVLCP